jgi:hypothetical protein
MKAAAPKTEEREPSEMKRLVFPKNLSGPSKAFFKSKIVVYNGISEEANCGTYGATQ